MASSVLDRILRNFAIVNIREES